MEEKESNSIYDWVVIRRWGKPSENEELCILTTRGFLLTRIIRLHLRENLQAGRKVPGLRRYRTKNRADMKADKLNRRFKTGGYSSIREDGI